MAAPRSATRGNEEIFLAPENCCGGGRGVVGVVLGDVGVMHRCLMVTGHTAPAGQLRLIDGVVILPDGGEVVAGAAGRAGVWRAAAVPSYVPTVRYGDNMDR